MILILAESLQLPRNARQGRYRYDRLGTAVAERLRSKRESAR